MSHFANTYIGMNEDMTLSCEAYLIQTCAEYDINYETCEPNPVEYVQEGIISGIVKFIKAIFQKVIALLVKIWKAIVGFLRKFIGKCVDFFKRLLGFDTPKKVEIKSGIISKPGVVEEKTFTSKDEIVDAYKKANQAFDQEITKLEQQNIGFTKRMEQKVSRDIAKEDYVTGLLERVGYNKGRLQDGEVQLKHLQGDLKAAYNDKKANGNVQGSNRAEHQSVANIDFLKNRSMEIVLESKNLAESYAVFMEKSMGRLRQHAEKISNNKRIRNYDLHKDSMKSIVDISESLKKLGASDTDINQYLGFLYFPTFEGNTDAEAEQLIRKWLRLRINWNNGIIRLLQSMISKNAELLHIDINMVEAISNDLSKGKLTSMRKLLADNRDKIVNDELTLIDGRKIGLRGVVCISDDLADDQYWADENDNIAPIEGGWVNMLTDFKHNDTALTYMSKYDVTIIAHGIDTEGKIDEWVVEKVRTPKGSYPGIYKGYTKMNDYIRALIKQGYKRINIVSCNPEHHKLDPDIQKSNKVLIRMSMNNTLISH